jgi:hypothetical protein
MRNGLAQGGTFKRKRDVVPKRKKQGEGNGQRRVRRTMGIDFGSNDPFDLKGRLIAESIRRGCSEGSLVREALIRFLVPESEVQHIQHIAKAS